MRNSFFEGPLQNEPPAGASSPDLLDLIGLDVTSVSTFPLFPFRPRAPCALHGQKPLATFVLIATSTRLLLCGCQLSFTL